NSKSRFYQDFYMDRDKQYRIFYAGTAYDWFQDGSYKNMKIPALSQRNVTIFFLQDAYRSPTLWRPNRRHSQNPGTDICDLVLCCGKQQQDPARMLCAEYDEDGRFIGIVKDFSVDPATYMPVSLDVDASSTLRIFAIDSASAAPLADEAECPPVADEE
ncbi:MAG: PRC-barrel domain-containing protein, partial [Clostridia bacterium]|nr:PRC-barrel domain-containing protein [Clostridia bacterium]